MTTEEENTPLRFEGGTKQEEGETDWYAWLRVTVYATGEVLHNLASGPHSTQEKAREALAEAQEIFMAIGPVIKDLNKEKQDGKRSVKDTGDRPGKYLH